MKTVIFVLVWVYSSAAVSKYSNKIPRIIGGNEATPHSFPYQALLDIYSGDEGWYCGGSLISQNYVITAAHCVDGADTIDIILGAHNPFESEDTQIQLRSTQSDILIHELYSSEEITNNIAVIKLPISVHLTNAIKIISLPYASDVNKNYTGALSTATGWGSTNGTGDTMSDVLNYVQLTVISNADCETYFGDVGTRALCTSGLESTGLCLGDDGGPLVTDATLIGVYSFGEPQCKNGYPAVFTKVASYIEWLRANTDAEIED